MKPFHENKRPNETPPGRLATIGGALGGFLAPQIGRTLFMLWIWFPIVVFSFISYELGYVEGRDATLISRPLQKAWHECQDLGGNWMSIHHLDDGAPDITCVWKGAE